MSITKLTGNIKSLTEIAKINEIIDSLNSGAVITVDSEMSSTSENPVQNKVIYSAFLTKQDTLTAGVGISISEDNIISCTQNSAEWGNIQGTLSEQADLMSALSEKQGVLTAGTGISISNTNEISVVGGTAEWGNIQGNLSEQTDLMSALNEKQNTLTAGTNVSISDEGIISATDTTYTAGTGISISDEGVISSTQTSAEWGSIIGNLSEQSDLVSALDLKQNLLTAGSGISISSEGIISTTENLSYSATCPAITPVNGFAIWQVTHNLGTQNVIVALYSGDVEVQKNVQINNNNQITITFDAINNVAEGSRKVVIVANGSSANIGGLANTNLSNITNAGKINVSNCTFPSSTYTELNIESSSTTYSAPANGWFWLRATVTPQRAGFAGMINVEGKLTVQSANDSYSDINIIIPVSKNNQVLVYYWNMDSVNLTFVYAKGSESEAN